MRWLRTFLLLVLAVPLGAQTPPWNGILSSNRATDWTKSGLPPTLPTGETTTNPWTPPIRTQCGSTLPSSTSYATINSTIAGCASGTYVLLGPGTFSTSPATINLTKSGVTLRGSGADQTKMVCGTSCSFTTQGSTGGGSFTWTGPYTAGTTVINLSGTPSVGAEIVPEGDGGNTDTGSVWICADNGVCNGGTPGTATQYEIHRVTAASAGVVTITPPISFTAFASLANLRVAQVSPGPTNSVGLEDMTIDCLSSGANCVFLGYTYGSWIKGVRILNGVPPQVGISNASNCLIMNNYTAQPQINVVEPLNPNTISFNLIINNIFSGGGSFVQGPGSTDVWAYNLARDVYNTSGQFFDNNTISDHTPGYSMNLVEGNEIGNWQEDNIHGTANLNTFFRNVLYGTDPPFNADATHGWSLQLAGVSRMENVIGNVMGNSNQATYKCINPPFGDTCIVPVSGSATGITDTLTAQSVMLWGNYDVITGAIRWCGNSSNPGWSTTCSSTSEVPTSLGGAAATYNNAVPVNLTLPASFFTGVTSHPSGGTGLSFNKVCTNYPTCTAFTTLPYPYAGPDVTSGNINGTGGFPNYAGFANHIPAYVAWKNLPIDTSYQTTYSITSSSWSGGINTLTITGLPAHNISGEFQITGATGCNGTFMLINQPSTTTVTYSVTPNPGSCAGASFLFPDIRTFNETVYRVDSTVWAPGSNGRDYVNGGSNGKSYSNGVTGANGRKYP